jgi:hypothetical protein
MSKTLKTIGIVLGAVALIATGIGAVVAGGALLGISGATFTAIGTIAGIAATAANIGSQALARPPPSSGSVSQVLIQTDAPRPYPIGEGYFAGVLRYRTGYGGVVDKVTNPYMWDVIVYSGVGPVNSISPRVDYQTIPAWYSGYIATATKLGAMPETALTASYGTPPSWNSASKISGAAQIGWNYKFDKNGKKFAGGVPLIGAYGQWNKAYDPRLDSTFPGGSGSHRLNNEATWTYTANPALHAGTYAYGRYQNGILVMGVGLPTAGIDWQAIASWANTCDANVWTLFGVLFEPGDRWANLREICLAGGGEPAFSGAVLSFKWDAPVVSLDTIVEDDLAEGSASITAMQSYRDRLNTVAPKYRSPDHNWEMIQAEQVQEATYLLEDGEERREEWPFNMVKGLNQATQLATYKMANSREFFPIVITCKPRMRGYKPGDCLHLDLPQLGLDHDAIIMRRRIDPGTMTVELTLIGETPEKHAYALGKTGVAPPSPALVQTSQERDETSASGQSQQVSIEVEGVRTFSADYTGSVSTLLPSYIQPKISLEGDDIRDEDFVSYSIVTNGVTATVNNTPGSPDKGTIEITAVDTLNGFIDLTVVVSGITYPAKRIVIQKSTGLPPGFGGAGAKIANDSGFNQINTSSFVAITDVMTVTLAGGESLYGTAPLDYWVNSSTSAPRTASAKWQYSPTGAGTWSDFGTAITGSVATGGFGPTSGYGAFSHSKSGLSAGNYDVRLVAALNTTGVNVTFTGVATIEAKT